MSVSVCVSVCVHECMCVYVCVGGGGERARARACITAYITCPCEGGGGREAYDYLTWVWWGCRQLQVAEFLDVEMASSLRLRIAEPPTTIRSPGEEIKHVLKGQFRDGSRIGPGTPRNP